MDFNNIPFHPMMIIVPPNVAILRTGNVLRTLSVFEYDEYLKRKKGKSGTLHLI